MNDLLIPYAGLRENSSANLKRQNEYGYYWSTTPHSPQSHADLLSFDSSYITTTSLILSRAYGASVRCFKNSTAVTNGVCGSANGTTTSTKPTTNLCSAGNASTVSGNGQWTWTCTSPNGGSNASCSANKNQRRNVDTNCDQDDKTFSYNSKSYTVAGCNSTINATYKVAYTTKDNSFIQDRTQ